MVLEQQHTGMSYKCCNLGKANFKFLVCLRNLCLFVKHHSDAC